MARSQGTRAKNAEEFLEDCARVKHNGPLIATLIDSYELNPQQVRTQLRKQLRLKGLIPPNFADIIGGKLLFLS